MNELRELLIAEIANELGDCDDEICGNTRRQDCAYHASAERIASRLLALPQLASVGRDSSSQSQPRVALSRADTKADDTGWRRADRLLYTLAATGQYRHGEPVLANRFMVDVSWDRRYATDDEGEALIAALADFLVRPLPNTPLSAGKDG